MAGTTYTTFANAQIIANNPLLAAFADLYGYDGSSNPYFTIWDDLNLTYTMQVNAANPDGLAMGAWTQELTDAVVAAFEDIAAVSGLSFTAVASGADIDFWAVDVPGAGYTGYSYGIGGSGVYMNMAYVYSMANDGVNGLAYGGYNYRTVIHEILHNVGIMHPHDNYANLPGVVSSGDAGTHRFNQNIYTVMSYNRVQQTDHTGRETTGWPWTLSTVDQSFGVLGTFDIAILQSLYGANMTHALGDDIYIIPEADGDGVYFKAIWDAGGTDELRYNGSGNVTIDLRAATLDMADGALAGGNLSIAEGVHGGFNIANGVVIENATGGSGNDEITGNNAKNTLIGNQGSDTILGLTGKDTIEGGGGADSIEGGGGADNLDGGNNNDTIKGGGGGDTADGGNGDDSLKGGNGDDTLSGSAGKDTLRAGNNDDRIEGEGDNDVIWGNSGADTFVFGLNADVDRIKDFEDDVDTIEIDAALLGAGVTTAADVVATYGSIDAKGNLVLNFGGGDKLIIEDNGGLTLNDLINDISIV